MNLNFPGDITFAPGSLNALGKKIASLDIERPLLISDPAMTGLGLTARAAELAAGPDGPPPLYDRCVENPRAPEVSEAAAMYRDEGCDGVVALGGGSVIDVAKGVRVVAAGGGEILNYDMAKGGIKRIGRDLPPMIAVPTTAGSGSETTLGAVIIDPEIQFKVLIFSPFLISTAILLDPEITLTMPPKLTAATGMDALVHAIEAYTSPADNLVADGLCMATFQAVGQNLPRAVAEGQDIKARGNMMLAALMGGMAFAAKGLGAVHALAHQLSSHYGLPHGLANALMLPVVMRYNAEAAGEKYLTVCRAMGLEAETPDQAVEALAAFARGLDMAGALREFGVKEAKLAEMAASAAQDLSLRSNPAPCTPEDLAGLYRQAL
ncbi:MAG: iron-containing alcohol dehydrogenase [Desulfarculaceae bacterium]|nr:iron-containing alcohol dehydrogenase [Desulfarculaceae bacterium]MCF8071696.1 iron-containing alcohol dehydrogenase [Desulfarculaceae bacterium]MCF8102457.1 iron-containing alcohol dehydrogenase [Desulfarculaceae bacterium]MCF8116799.1 iron-containing alcohol dehydrogenase [Desulfarculaceae bacterium]